MADFLQGLIVGNGSEPGEPFNVPPPNANLVTNIAAPHTKFLDALSQYGASVPINSFWIVQFDIPYLITEQNLRNLSETFANNDLAKQTLESDKFVKNVGCIFCRSFDFGGEINTSSVPEMDVRGFRSVPFAGGRNSALFGQLGLTFYESTVSFIDYIIRPWIILMSYYSTIARNDAVYSNNNITNLKQDITCYLMTRTGIGNTQQQREVNQTNNGSAGLGIANYNNPWGVRKTIVFKNCFPKDMSTLDYNQSNNNNLETARTTFCYTSYELTHTHFAN